MDRTITRYALSALALSALTSTLTTSPIVPSAIVPSAQAQDIACAVPKHTELPPPDPSIQQLRPFGTGRGIRVAVIDTGVHPHEQLRHLHPGKDFVTPSTPDPLRDCDNHGTAVAGIIAGRDHGIAPDAELIAIRQTSAHYRESSGSLETLTAAIHNALDEQARIINLSIVSCLPPHIARRVELDELHAALDRAEREGAVVVAAAGNATNECGDGFSVFPAHLPTVLAIGAREDAHTMADYSIATPPGLTPLSAPGTVPFALASDGNGYATGTRTELNPDGSWRFSPYTGTSFAAPAVSGALAVLLQRFPHLSPTEIRTIVAAAAEPHGGALQPEAIITQLPPTRLTASPIDRIEATPPQPSHAPARWWIIIAALFGISAAALTARSFTTGKSQPQ